MNKKIKLITILLLMLASQNVSAIQREDVLECGLPNGDKFVLTAKYDYSPMAKFIRHAAKRTNQTPFSVTYLAINNKTENLKFSIPAVTLEQLPNAEAICAGTGSASDFVFGRFGFFYKGVNVTKSMPVPPKEKSIYTLMELNSEKVQQTLKTNNYLVAHGVLTRKNDVITSEVGLVEHCKNGAETEYDLLAACPIVEVYKIASLDNGKTWSEPIFTKELAEVYILNKPVLKQSFIARPISINGKKIEANFPPQP